MTTSLLNCRGFDLGQFHVPSFEVRPAEVLTLALPASSELTSILGELLTGIRPSADIEIIGQSVRATPARARTGWRGLFPARPADWLIGQGFTRSEADVVLARHQIDNRFRLNQYAATPKMLLGLEAVYHRRPDVIVFDTTGLDPNGWNRVRALVQSRLGETAAVYLSSPIVSQGKRSTPVFPESSVAEVVARPAVSV